MMKKYMFICSCNKPINEIKNYMLQNMKIDNSYVIYFFGETFYVYGGLWKYYVSNTEMELAEIKRISMDDNLHRYYETPLSNFEHEIDNFTNSCDEYEIHVIGNNEIYVCKSDSKKFLRFKSDIMNHIFTYILDNVFLKQRDNKLKIYLFSNQMSYDDYEKLFDFPEDSDYMFGTYYITGGKIIIAMSLGKNIIPKQLRCQEINFIIFRYESTLYFDSCKDIKNLFNKYENVKIRVVENENKQFTFENIDEVDQLLKKFGSVI
jgi:hypothetical protein